MQLQEPSLVSLNASLTPHLMPLVLSGFLHQTLLPLPVHFRTEITPGIPLKYSKEPLEVKCHLGRLGLQRESERGEHYPLRGV